MVPPPSPTSSATLFFYSRPSSISQIPRLLYIPHASPLPPPYCIKPPSPLSHFHAFFLSKTTENLTKPTARFFL